MVCKACSPLSTSSQRSATSSKSTSWTFVFGSGNGRCVIVHLTLTKESLSTQHGLLLTTRDLGPKDAGRLGLQLDDVHQLLDERRCFIDTPGLGLVGLDRTHQLARGFGVKNS